jgi:hypothetical protein
VSRLPRGEARRVGVEARRLDTVVEHLAAVNGWTADDPALYLEAAFETWAARSRHRWNLDISVLGSRYGLDDVDR